MTDQTVNKTVPSWVDMQRLCREICSCPSTVDILVRERKLPPPKRLRGKFVWHWETVNAWIANEGPPGEKSGSLEARIRDEARQALMGRRA